MKYFRLRKKKQDSAGTSMWKVAYADFTTAMMALFMILWILAKTPEDKLKGIAEYFAEHKKQNKQEDFINKDSSSINEKNELSNLLEVISKSDKFKAVSNNMKASLSLEGLKIHIMDSEDRAMFVPGTDILQAYMSDVLQEIAELIKDLSCYVAISGHTASLVNPQSSNVDLWELSILRANAVRKFLVSSKVNPDKIIRIIGKANREPIEPLDIYNPKNIRIELLILDKKSVGLPYLSLPKDSLKLNH